MTRPINVPRFVTIHQCPVCGFPLTDGVCDDLAGALARIHSRPPQSSTLGWTQWVHDQEVIDNHQEQE